MPQVILHAASTIDQDSKAGLVRAVREAIPRVLGIDEMIGQVLLYETPPHRRAIHESRDGNFVVVEIMMYPGRTAEMKAKLANEILALVTKFTGVGAKDINVVIHEIPPENYMGGTSHKYIEDLRQESPGS